MLPLDVLLEHRRAFLRFLERKVGSREAAEDLLQEALTRHLSRDVAVPDDRLVPWFYRVLRHAAIDYRRRRASADRALSRLAREMDDAVQPSPEFQNQICPCVNRVASTLKPEYADALRQVDVAGIAVKAFAERHGISTSNAGVRVFRARRALRERLQQSCGACAEQGCLDCTCVAPAAVV